MPRAPFPRASWEAGSAIACGDRAYVVGGRSGYGRSLSDVFEYEALGDRWTARAPLPIPVAHPACVEVAGTLFVYGGVYRESEQHHDYVRSLQVYDPTSDSWHQGQPLPVEMVRGQAVADQGRVFVFMDGWRLPGEKRFRNEQIVMEHDFVSGRWWRHSLVGARNFRFVNAVPLVAGHAYLTDREDENGRSPEVFRVRLTPSGFADDEALPATRK